jgi:transcription termination/antitermination protein NusA
MTNDIVALIDYYEKEKGIDRDKVVAALEYAFISAYRKMVPGADAIETLRAEVNTKKGETRIFASLKVVPDEEYTDKFNEVPLKLASRRKADAAPEDQMEFDVTPKDFGRIAVQTAKQTMMQRLRQAEKEMIYEEFKDRAGDIVSGTVRRFDRSDVLIDLGKFEGVMPSRERVQTEEYNIGDRIRAYVVAVENEGRGPEIILSFPAATRISSAACSKPRSTRSPTAPSKSAESPARPATAPRSPSGAPTTRSTRSAPASDSEEPG